MACERDLGRGQSFLLFLSLADHIPERGNTSGKVSEKRDNPHVCAHLRKLMDFQYVFIKLSFAVIFLI